MKNLLTYLLIISAVTFSCRQKHDPKVETANQSASEDSIPVRVSGNVIYDTTKEASHIVDSYSNGLFAIEAAKTVKQKTQLPDVKHFADMVSALQIKKVTEFENLAKLKRISLPSNLNLIQRYKLKEIAEKEPGSLEKVFIEEIEINNNEEIALLEKVSKESEDNDIATVAISNLAVLKMQSDEIKSAKENLNYN